MSDKWPISARGKLARSIKTSWSSSKFLLQLNELLTLALSWCVMAAIAVLAFVACAVLQ
jgi:hypothetical protein